MPLLDKLLPSRKSSDDSDECRVSSARTAENDRDSVLRLGADQVRILLFRECEWRGRKLLFDSMSVQKHRNKSETVCTAVTNNAERMCKTPLDVGTARDFERDKTIEDDVSLLSEMVFGTVAMTYKGSSFKVHSMNSPPCVICTKIFPATEHGTCHKSNGRASDEGLGRSVHVDSASSNNTSVRSFLSRPSSGNLSSNDSHPSVRKSSTCSSTGSGWDIDVAPSTGSSQSLESNGSSGIGSLTSLRRRWHRAVSTSLGRSDSDDAFGMQHWNENGSDGRDGHTKRHKTRLGLTMLVRLTQDHESRMQARLLEHIALLEGMLNRLRYFCIEVSGTASSGSSCKGRAQLADRMCRATSRFIVSLLHILLNVDASSRAPLLWHDVLLNSVTVKEKTNTLHRTLQQMCQLFDELDTKSTNFFLSTVLTAVLTYHLGWVYTVLSPRDRQIIEKLGNWYSCNPLWAQLSDLYGALGNPLKVAHTVVAGDPRKSDLINSVLTFLSYFIRSGIVRKSLEYRCSWQEDVEKAVDMLQQARSKRPYLFNNRKSTHASNDRDASAYRRESRVLPSRKPVQPPRDTGNDGNAPRYTAERPRISRSVSPFKRSDTVKSDLSTLMTKSTEASMEHFKFPEKEFPLENCYDKYDGPYTQDDQSMKSTEKNSLSQSKIKIVINEVDSQEDITPKDSQPRYLLRSFEKKLNVCDAEQNLATGKTESLNQPDLVGVDPLKVYYNRPELPLLDADRRYVDEFKESQVFFTLGGEDKSVKLSLRSRPGNTCQCSYTFTRVPSTSAQLPEGVLRKIIQRNFPESSKSIQPPPGAASRSIGFCLKCNGQGGYVASRDYVSKQMLETPTNATEVLRTCGSSEGNRSTRLSRSNSLEALMEANSVVELPMPQSRKVSSGKSGPTRETVGFARTLLRNRMTNNETNLLDTGYTWGLVLQGVKKKKRRKKKRISETDERDTSICEAEPEEEKWWWSCIREEVTASVRFPTIDQPVAEALCVLADLDTWHVGILSNNAPWQNPPLPVGMSRLVSNMLESFAYVWRKYHSPTHCIAILEAKLRELWLRSEALAEMMMSVEECDANVNSLTNALDLDAADIPLLLAVATTHSPEIAQRFGLTLT